MIHVHISQLAHSVYTLIALFQTADGSRQEVKFACSREELQDLVAKLKDACTQVDRILGTSRK